MAQADARSMMTGRITDAYTNITTVKLFSHTQRESSYVQSAMTEFLKTVHRQMRMVTGFEIVNNTLSMGLIMSTAGVSLWLWTQGRVGIGAAAAATAMGLRLNGISHWVMWEMASLFEQIGTVQDGIGTLAHRARPARCAAAARHARRHSLRRGAFCLWRGLEPGCAKSGRYGVAPVAMSTTSGASARIFARSTRTPL
jgi:ABC-type multidrug transport system fused ATPase/permease subunit